MNRFIQTIFTLSLALSGLIFSQQVNAALADDLKDGQHVLLMRHADAPGIGDPPGYVISQCSSQRNLGEYGKKQAKAIGAWLSSQGVQKANVFSSPWCRCLDTANLINKGPAKIEPSLASFFDDMSLEKSQTKALERFTKSELAKQPKLPLILVSHHVNIQAYTGKVLGVGDMILVRTNKDGEYLSHTIYPSPKASE
jgi:phosphohistidine phosphatase SixA